MGKGMWVYNPKPAKLTQNAKDFLLKRVNNFVASSERLSKEVNRIDIRAGRIYLFHLVEQFIPTGIEVQFIKPLIDGKYVEYPMARITLFDAKGEQCTADWLRHTGQWYKIYEGSLDECLKFIEDNQQWF